MKPLPFEITGPYRRNPRSPWRWAWRRWQAVR